MSSPLSEDVSDIRDKNKHIIRDVAPEVNTSPVKVFTYDPYALDYKQKEKKERKIKKGQI